MKDIFEEFNSYFQKQDKEAAVTFVLEKLESGQLDVVSLYEQVLGPALNGITCDLQDRRLCIWKEHIQTGIVRTIVECAYPYVLKKQKELDKKSSGTAIVICPPEEYHDIGARMVADYFTICGCSSIYIGSNTPCGDIKEVVELIRPEYLAISVSNIYNLVVTKKIIKEVKSLLGISVSIVVGGSAFAGEAGNIKEVDGDYYADTFQDIEKMVEACSKKQGGSL